MADTTYTLGVAADDGTTHGTSVEVKAIDLGKVTSFQADRVVRPGEFTTMTAVFEGASRNVPAATKSVPAVGATWTLTVTNGLGEAIKKSLTVTTKKEMFVTKAERRLGFKVHLKGDKRLTEFHRARRHERHEAPDRVADGEARLPSGLREGPPHRQLGLRPRLHGDDVQPG